MIIKLLLFPGILFTVVTGLLVGWLDRKLSARFQYRVGPPLWQNFNDIFKLAGKETIIPKEGTGWLFVAAPLLVFATLGVLSLMVGLPLFYREGFTGDLIVIMYLLMIYSVMVILGGAASGNVYSSMGAGREIKLLLADELAFILICLVAIIQSGFQLQLQGIIAFQQAHGPIIGSVSGCIAFIIGLITIQAKMALPPFHIPEAETEIVEGPFMEYSGPLLAFWKLNQAMLYVLLPLLLVALFLGGFQTKGLGLLWGVLKYLLIVFLMIVIKNTNPRVRIDTALRFFWRIASPLSFAAVVLAVIGV